MLMLKLQVQIKKKTELFALYLNSDFNRCHDQVSALRRPGVYQLSTQSSEGLGEQHLAIVVETR